MLARDVSPVNDPQFSAIAADVNHGIHGRHGKSRGRIQCATRHRKSTRQMRQPEEPFLKPDSSPDRRPSSLFVPCLPCIPWLNLFILNVGNSQGLRPRLTTAAPSGRMALEYADGLRRRHWPERVSPVNRHCAADRSGRAVHFASEARWSGSSYAEPERPCRRIPWISRPPMRFQDELVASDSGSTRRS